MACSHSHVPSRCTPDANSRSRPRGRARRIPPDAGDEARHGRFINRRRDDSVSPQPLSEAVGGVKVAADLSRTIACLAEGRDEAVQVGTERASLRSSADVGPDPVRVEHDLLLSRDRWGEETIPDYGKFLNSYESVPRGKLPLSSCLLPISRHVP